MTRKQIIVGCVSGFLLMVVLVCAAVYVIYKQFAPLLSMAETPEELKQPRVMLGREFLEKTLFVEAKDLGDINSIVYGELDPSPGPELAFVGQTGALFVDERGTAKTLVSFKPQVESVLGFKSPSTRSRYGEIQVVDVDGDHVCEFLVRNNFHKSELIDHTGKSLWTYERDEQDSFLEDTAAGDLDGDGRIEYVAAYLGGKGLILLDSSRAEIWSKPDVHANSVVLADTDGDGKLEIVHDNFDRIVVRNDKGKVISENESDFYIGHFSLVRWPDKISRVYALHHSDGMIQLFDFGGKSVVHYQAPLSDKLFRIHGVTAKLISGEPEYFAAVAESTVFRRSVLYVYRPDDKLIYQEVLPQSCQSIFSLRLGASDEESILLGCKGEILRYQVPGSSGKKK